MINAIRAHLAEFGIVAPVGRKGVEQLFAMRASDWDLIRECHYGQRSYEPR